MPQQNSLPLNALQLTYYKFILYILHTETLSHKNNNNFCPNFYSSMII